MYLIGLDIGTTGAKAVLTDSSGTIISKGYQGYPLISRGNCVEQDAKEWIAASIAAIRTALSGNEDKQVVGISLSTQGASMVAVDHTGAPIGNAYTWMDSRASAQAEQIRNALGDEYVYQVSGWKITPTLDAAKIMYMKKQPEFRAAKRFLSTIEVVNQFLTGSAVIDPSNASMRQLYDIRTGDWNDRLLSAVGVSREELPELKPAGETVGGLTLAAAKQLGLKPGIPVFNGAHDQYCASLGAAATADGDMLLSTGTTWVVLGIGSKPLFTNTYMAPGVHPIKGLYGSIASMNGSGVSLEWYKNKFLPHLSYSELDMQASQRSCDDLFFYPYVTGATYPIWNLNARGSFQGITLEHGPADFARSIMEGVAFGVKSTLMDYALNGTQISKLKIMGGAAKSNLWSTLITDISGVETQTLQEPDACALGAAIIAAYGAGIYPDLNTAAHSMVKLSASRYPDEAQKDYLDKKYTRYASLREFTLKYYQ